MRTITYKVEVGFKVAYVRKKFFGPQNLKIFLFLYKRRYYIAIYYCIEKCKPALRYK